MSRFLPKSLIGQIALLMAVALMIAQAINFSLVYNERQRATRAQVEAPAISRFITFAQRLAASPPEQRQSLIPDWGRRTRYALATESFLQAAANEERISDRLRETASENNLTLRDVRAAIVEEPREFRRRDRGRQLQLLLLSAQFEDGVWLNARMVTHRPNPWAAARAAGSTLLI